MPPNRLSPATLADLMREVGIQPSGHSLYTDSIRRPIPRTDAYVPMRDVQLSQRQQQQSFSQLSQRQRIQGELQRREAYDPGIDPNTGMTQAQEALLYNLEPTGVPSLFRSYNSFQEGRPLEGAGHGALGLLGALGTASLAATPARQAATQASRLPMRSTPAPRSGPPPLYELDDSAASVQFRPSGEYRLGDVLDHPALYARHPNLADHPIHLGAGGRTVAGEAGPDAIRIDPRWTAEGSTLSNSGYPEFRKIVLHEVQHEVDRLEGRSVQSGTPSWLDRNVYLGDVSPDQAYRRLPTEQLAWATEARANMTAAERAANPPFNVDPLEYRESPFLRGALRAARTGHMGRYEAVPAPRPEVAAVLSEAPARSPFTGALEPPTRLPVNPTRDIAPNGLPIRPSEPFRTSLNGGSDDLLSAARQATQSARLPMRGALNSQETVIPAVHSTRAEFDSFDPSYIGSRDGDTGWRGRGFYFYRDTPEFRARYSGNDYAAGAERGFGYGDVWEPVDPQNWLTGPQQAAEGSRTVLVNLHLRRLITDADMDDPSVARAFADAGYSGIERHARTGAPMRVRHPGVVRGREFEAEDADAFARAAERLGYDGGDLGGELVVFPHAADRIRPRFGQPTGALEPPTRLPVNPRSAARQREVFDVPVSSGRATEVIRNPSQADLMRLSVLPRELGQETRQTAAGQLRYIQDANGDVYVFRGWDAIHDDVAAGMDRMGRRIGGYQRDDGSRTDFGRFGYLRREGDTFVSGNGEPLPARVQEMIAPRRTQLPTASPGPKPTDPKNQTPRKRGFSMLPRRM